MACPPQTPLREATPCWTIEASPWEIARDAWETALCPMRRCKTSTRSITAAIYLRERKIALRNASEGIRVQEPGQAENRNDSMMQRRIVTVAIHPAWRVMRDRRAMSDLEPVGREPRSNWLPLGPSPGPPGSPMQESPLGVAENPTTR